jgi:hypothetical protein
MDFFTLQPAAAAAGPCDADDTKCVQGHKSDGTWHVWWQTQLNLVSNQPLLLPALLLSNCAVPYAAAP